MASVFMVFVPKSLIFTVQLSFFVLPCHHLVDNSSQIGFTWYFSIVAIFIMLDFSFIFKLI